MLAAWSLALEACRLSQAAILGPAVLLNGAAKPMSSLTPGPTVAVPSISTIATYTVSFIAGPGLKFELG